MVAVSIIVPCYKQAEYLEETLESVRGQTFRDWECIVVDDDSPDESFAIVSNFIRTDRRFVSILRRPNQGLSSARNAGIRASQGRYLLPLDSDDTLSPEALDIFAKTLNATPEVSVVFSDALLFSDVPIVTTLGRWRCGPFQAYAILNNNKIPYCALYRREVWTGIGGYCETLSGFEDWDFWLSAIERGFVGAHIPEMLFRYRLKTESMRVDAEKNVVELSARIRLRHPRCYTDAQLQEARLEIRIIEAMRAEAITRTA